MHNDNHAVAYLFSCLQNLMSLIKKHKLKLKKLDLNLKKKK